MEVRKFVRMDDLGNYKVDVVGEKESVDAVLKVLVIE